MEDAVEDKKAGNVHRLSIDERKSGVLTGIVDVHAFDETTISLLTECGKLLIKGEKLHVKSLELVNGKIEIEGKIDSLVYLSKNTKKREGSFLKHFFR